jgi:hypothetical protein
MLVSMSTILVLNAVSSLLAAAGIGGFLVHGRRRTPNIVVQPLYVPTTQS